MSTSFALSAAGAAFLAAHEGFVSKAYRCPAGVVTIGFGFTMGSRIFAVYWRKKHGRVLRMGDTVGRREAEILLQRMFDEEYGAAVNRDVRPGRQHHHDGAGSVAWNCGIGSLKWKWGQALAQGRVKEAARLLTTTAVTANGRRLAGLVRRRKEEAALIEFGRYTSVAAEPSISRSPPEVREYQGQLIALGYSVGPSGDDGVAGPLTLNAVKLFQQKKGLKVDGMVGPATRAALVRALDAKRGLQATGGAGGLGAAAGALPADLVSQPLDALLPTLASGAGAAIVIAFVSLAFQYRGRITGRRVPT